MMVRTCRRRSVAVPVHAVAGSGAGEFSEEQTGLAAAD